MIYTKSQQLYIYTKRIFCTAPKCQTVSAEILLKESKSKNCESDNFTIKWNVIVSSLIRFAMGSNHKIAAAFHIHKIFAKIINNPFPTHTAPSGEFSSAINNPSDINCTACIRSTGNKVWGYVTSRHVWQMPNYALNLEIVATCSCRFH